MVEIRYGEQYELADLAGLSVAEAQAQYISEFDIPEPAKAYLNGKEVGKDLEPRITLSDDDRLSFEAKRHRRGLMLLGLLLATLAITVSLFVSDYTTDAAAIGAPAQSNPPIVMPTSD